MGTWQEQNVRRRPDGKFDGYQGSPQDGQLDDDLPMERGDEPSPRSGDLKAILAVRADELSAMGFVPAKALSATLGDPRYAGGSEHLDTWWGAEKTLAEYGRPVGDYRQMPDNYTPSRTGGRGTFGLRRTHRMHYEGAGVSMRMPSAASIRRFEDEQPGKSIVVPVTAKTPHGDVTGWVRLTRARPGNNWETRAGGFGGDAAGAERAADMAEAVACVMESRKVTTALRNAGSLPERRRQRLAAEGAVTHRVTSSSFITGIGYNQAAGAVAVEIRGTTYGYSASPQDMKRFIDNAEKHGFGHAYNEFIKKPLTRTELPSCSKCGSTYAPHLTHRCRVKPVPGGATGGALGYEATARRSAAAFAQAARSSRGTS
jgi:hypothetical protein